MVFFVGSEQLGLHFVLRLLLFLIDLSISKFKLPSHQSIPRNKWHMRDFIKEWGQIHENTQLKLYYLITSYPQGQLWQDANSKIDELCINNIALHILVPSGNFKSNHRLNIYSIYCPLLLKNYCIPSNKQSSLILSNILVSK